MQSSTSSHQLNSCAESAWENVVSILKKDFGEEAFESWIKYLEFKSIENDVIHLLVPKKILRDIIVKNHYSQLKETVSCFFAGINIVDIRIKNRTIQKVDCDSNINHYNESNVHTLESRFTFDNFVVGASNKMAYSAAKAVANNKPMPGNVLFIYGSVGIGKTHLLQATARKLLRNPHKKITYLSAEDFMCGYVKAIKNNTLFDFKEKIRSIDVLLLDDIQFLCGKNGTQREFASTISALTEGGKTVVIASDCSPY